MDAIPHDPMTVPDATPLRANAADPIVVAEPATLFADRARRFTQLALRDHRQRPLFAFMSHLSHAQHMAASAHDPGRGPDAASLTLRHALQMPVLPASLGDGDRTWIAAVRRVVALSLASDDILPVGEAAAAARARIGDADDAVIERFGRASLAYDYEALPVDVVPWLSAGLQVHWVTAASRVGRAAMRSLDANGVCPCCGSLPVVSLRHSAHLQQELRYLVCALCATHWHMVRSRCSNCESTAAMSYVSLPSEAGVDASSSAAVVQAEVCDHCASYLKLVCREADANADPIADDLATLALDLVTDGRGYLRVGPNPFVHPGVAAD